MLYIHIGTHKTGTTTIQHYLKSKHEILSKHKINYIPKIEQLQTSYNKEEINIISSELLIGDLVNLYEDTISFRDRLFKIITKQGINDPKIIVFFREQSDFIQSSYTQLIQQGNDLDICDLIKFSDNLFYSRIIECWKEKFCIKVVPYDISLLENGGIVSLFFNQITENFLENTGTESKNISMSNNAMSVMKDIIELKKKNKTINLHAIRVFLQKLSPKKIFTNYKILPKNIIDDLKAKYADDNKMVFEKYIHNLAIKNFSQSQQEAEELFTKKQIQDILIQTGLI